MSKAGQLDWSVKERRERWGSGTRATGRQRLFRHDSCFLVSAPHQTGARNSASEAILLVVLRRDLLLRLEVQGVALLLRFCECDQGVLRRSDLSSSTGAQAVEHTEVERANEPKM
jgi:hypothetical protein